VIRFTAHRLLDPVALPGRALLKILVLALLALTPSYAEPRQGGGENGGGEQPAGYRAIRIEQGGSLTGRVLAHDPPPPYGDLPVTRDGKICGERIADERLIVASDGGVMNAVVSIEGITEGKAIDTLQRPRLENTGCRFRPHVQTVSVGQKLEIFNGDPLLHNTHAKMGGTTTVFNIALPFQNHKIPKLIREPGTMKVVCDAGHAWMSAWVAAFSHPYHAVTKEDGTFVIDGIPPGSYRAKAWHEELGSQLLEVTVGRAPTAISFSDLAR
jgi:hypothetical protein